MMRVYLSGPVTKGDRNWNYFQACVAHKTLMLAGYSVLNPMQTMCLPFAWDQSLSHHDWVTACLDWVTVSEMVIRLPGESEGADREVAWARKLKVPVYEAHEIPCLQEWFPEPKEAA